MRNKIPILQAELAEIDAALKKIPVTSPPSAELEAKTAEKKAKAAEIQKINIALANPFRKWRNYSKGLLYLGGAALTIGLLRVKTLADWHIAFVTDSSKGWLEAFFTTSLYSQAVFYTALLMAIYLPIVYALPETPESPSVEHSLEKKGFFATLTKFAPQLITLLSPLLAEPVFNVLKSVFA
jgi:hypothetical protein